MFDDKPKKFYKETILINLIINFTFLLKFIFNLLLIYTMLNYITVLIFYFSIIKNIIIFNIGFICERAALYYKIFTLILDRFGDKVVFSVEVMCSWFSGKNYYQASAITEKDFKLEQSF